MINLIDNFFILIWVYDERRIFPKKYPESSNLSILVSVHLITKELESIKSSLTLLATTTKDATI